jgi:uncharacterized protein
MLYACICKDIPNAGELRQQTREVHLEHLRGYAGAIVSAGPLLGDDGSTPVGSLLIVEAESLEAAREMMDDDPYAKAGLFERVDVYPWRWVVGTVKLQE